MILSIWNRFSGPNANFSEKKSIAKMTLEPQSSYFSCRLARVLKIVSIVAHFTQFEIRLNQLHDCYLFYSFFFAINLSRFV